MSDLTAPVPKPRFPKPSEEPVRNQVYETPVMHAPSPAAPEPRSFGGTVQDGRIRQQIEDIGIDFAQRGIAFDTDEEIARFNMATWLGPRTGHSVLDAYHNYDAVSELYFGQISPPKTAWQSIQDEWKTASLSVRSAHVAARMATTDWESEEFSDLFDDYLKVLGQMPSFDETSRPLWVKGLKAAASFGPSILATSMAGITGALVGTLFGAPGTGARVATMLESTTLAGGAIFGDILTTGVPLEDGREVPLWQYLDEHMPEEEGNRAKKQAVQLARAAASVGGVISGAIEMLQLDILTGGKLLNDSVGHAANSILRELVTTQRLANGAKALVLAHGANVAENVIQEFAQESVEWASAEMVTRTLERAHEIGLPERSVDQWAEEMKKVAETAALGSFLIGLPGSVRMARRAGAKQTPTGPGFRVPEGTREISADLLVPQDIEVSDAEKVIVARELASGTADPLQVYRDDDGTYRPADRRTQAAFDGLTAFKLDTVPINEVSKPEEDVWSELTEEEEISDDIDLDEEELDFDEFEPVENRDEAEIIADETAEDETQEVAPASVDEGTETAADAAQGATAARRAEISVQERWRKAKIKGKLVAEWKRQAGEAGNFPTTVLNGMEKIAGRIAGYLGMDVDQFIDTAFIPEAFVYKETIDNSTSVKGQARINSAGQSQIAFSKIADTSTFIHEFAHVMRYYLKDEHKSALEAHYGKNFHGYAAGATPTSEATVAEERFAQDFETYMTEGKAPTKELAGVFARLAQLMRDIYGVLRQALSGEVRTVFDEILGHDATLGSMELELEKAKNRLKKAKKAMTQAYAQDIKADEKEDEVKLQQSEADWKKGVGSVLPKSTPTLDLLRAFTLKDEQAVEKMRKDLGLKPTGQNPVHVVHKLLSKLTKESHGKELTTLDEDAREYLAGVLAAEAGWAIDNATKDAAGWYNKTLSRAMEKYSEKFPELRDDVGAQLMFKSALAITSQGMDVHSNSRYALESYKSFRETGKFNETKGWGESAKAMKSNFKLMNQLIKDFNEDWDKLDDFLQSYYTVAELESAGYKPKNENKNALLPASLVLGPKIGAGFFSNLMGNYDILTADLWFVRTASRWMGDAAAVTKEETKVKNTQALKDWTQTATKAEADLYFKGVTRIDTGEMLYKFEEEYTKESLQDNETFERWTEEVRLGINYGGAKLTKAKVANGFDKMKDDRRQEIKRIAEYRTETRAVPRSGSERQFFRDVVNDAVKKLINDGYDGITAADLQAVMWFFEKDLYTSLGAANKKAESADYADAAEENLKDEQQHTRRDATGARGRDPKSTGNIKKPQRGDRQGLTDWSSSITPPSNQTHPESTSGTFTRRGVKGSGAVLVTGDNATPIAAYTPNPLFSLFSENIFVNIDEKEGKVRGPGEKPHVFFEFDTDSAQAFQNAILRAKRMNTDSGFMVDVKDLETYQSGDYRMFMNEDGTAGFGVNRETGDIISVFKGEGGPRNASNTMIPLAIQAGGRRLDCFDTALPYIYGQFGFVDVARDKFNKAIIDEFVPDWKYDSKAVTKYAPKGDPDVVFMALNADVTEHGWLGYENYKDVRSGRKMKRGTYNPKNKSEYIEPGDWDAGVEAQNVKIQHIVKLQQTQMIPHRFSAPLPPAEYERNRAEWFGDSVVKDQGGRPLEVYHSSPISISQFDTDNSNPFGAGGRALYFTESPVDAGNYSDESGPDIAHKLNSREERYIEYLLQVPEEFVKNEDIIEMYMDWEGSLLPGDTELENWIYDNHENIAIMLAKEEVLGGRNVHPVILKIENPFDEQETFIDLDPGSADMANFYDAMDALDTSEDHKATVFNLVLAEPGTGRLQGIEFKRALERAFADMETHPFLTEGSEREAARMILEGMGYDGIVMYTENYNWGDWTPADRHFLAFDGKQVKSSYNVGTWDKNDLTIFRQEVSHEEAVQREVSEGRPVADTLLEEYSNRPWAAKELKRRKLMREQYSWITPLAKEVDNWESLKKLVVDEYSENLPNEKPPKNDFYKRAWLMANLPDRDAANASFMEEINTTAGIRQLVADLHDGRDKLSGLGLHPRMLGAARKGVIGRTSDIDVLQSLVARRPEVYRKALALSKNDKTAIAHLRYEYQTATLEADPQRNANLPTRMSVAASVADPQLRKLALSGKATGKELKALATQYKNIKDDLETQVARSEGKTARAEQNLEAYKENAQKRKDLQKIRNYRLKLAKNISRKIPKSVDLSARMMIEEVRKGFEPKNITEKTKEKRAQILEDIAKDPALKATMKPSEIRKLMSKPLDEWTTEELEDMNHRVTTLINIGKRIQADKKQARKNELDGVTAQGIIDTLGKEKADELAGIGSREAEKTRAGDKNIIAAPWGSVVKGTFRPPRVFRALFGENSPIYEWFVTKVNKATDASLEKLHGRREISKMRMEQLGITDRLLAKDETVDGMTYTHDQIIHMYLAMKNLKSRAALIYGNKISEAQVTKFTNTLTAEERQWGDFLLSEFDDNYVRLREAYRDYANEDMGREENYFPMLRLGVLHENLTKELADQILTRNAWKAAYVGKKFSISRINIADENQSAIRLGATAIWTDQIEKQEHFIASGALTKDLHAIRNQKDFRLAVAEAHGDKFNKWIEKYVNDFASPHLYKAQDGTSKLFATLRGNYALGALSLNMLTMLKQIPSLTLFLSRVGPVKLMAAAGEFLLNGNAMIEFAHSRDPQTKDSTMGRHLEELKERQKTGKRDRVAGIAKWGMKPIQWIDTGVKAIGWNAVYRDMISRGFSEDEAIQAAQMAVLETQPSGRAKDLAEIYRGPEVQNWLTMFTNQINQIWNMGAADLPYAIREKNFRDAAGIAVGISINFAVMTLASGWRPPEDEDDRLREFSYQAFRQMMNTLPLVGSVIYGATSSYGYSGVNPFPAAEAIGNLSAFAFKDDKSMQDFMKTLRYASLDAALFTGVPGVAANRVWKAAEEMSEQDYWDAVGQMFGPAFREEIERDE